MKLERLIYVLLGVLVGAMLASHCRAQVSIMGGMSKFEKPDDGIYWNHNQSHDFRLTPPAGGLRYDWTRWAVQYTWFGEVTSNALAVSADAPAQGGYIANTGRCVGTCAELWRWKMQSETQSIAAFYKFPFESGFTLEAGINVFEIRTKGHFEYPYRNPQEAGVMTYREGRYLGVGPAAGVSYRSGDWSVHWQIFRMEGKLNDPFVQGSNDTPPNWRESIQLLWALAWRFK